MGAGAEGAPIEPLPLHGLWCAALTPLRPDGAIDPAAWVAHLTGLLAHGVDGIVLFGTTGEGPSFSAPERRAGLESVLPHVPPDRLVAATGCAAFTDAVALIRHAVQAGCPRCLVLPPFFWKDLSDEAVYRYYASLIDIIGDPCLRLYLYHIPHLSGVPIQPEVVGRLAESYPGIVAGVKDSGGDFAHTAGLLAQAPRLSILTGHEPHLSRLVRAGGAGGISGLANLYPQPIRALLRPDAGAAEEARITHLQDIILRLPFVAALKAILSARTHNPAWLALRPPLNSLDGTARAALLTALGETE